MPTIKYTTQERSRVDLRLDEHSTSISSLSSRIGDGLWSSITPPALPAGNTNNYNPTGLANANVIYQDINAAGSTITGLAAQTVGRVVTIVNIHATADLTLDHDNATLSIGTNRFSLPNSEDLVIPPNGSVRLLYGIGVWRAVSVSFPSATSVAVFDVTDYGAVGDGVTSNNSAIILAVAAAVASGAAAELYFPGGTYVLSRDGTNAYALDLLASNLVLRGEPGKTIIKAQAGMPGTQVALLRIDNRDNVTIRDIIFDGNWGNAVTTIAVASNNAVASSGTYNVADTTGFPASGTFSLVTPSGTQTITYTGKTATTFTGCTGGTGTLKRGDVVGYLDAATGINHTDQADPKSHLVMVRGSRNVTIENCVFRQAYGDFVWTGYSSDSDTENWSRNVRIIGCRGDISARNGITIGQATEGVVVRDSAFTNIYATAFDIEPQGDAQPVRDVLLDHCKLGLWFNPNNVARTANSSINIVGGNSLATGHENLARKIHVRECEIFGSAIVYAASNVIFEGNRFVCDFAGNSYAPIYVTHLVDGLDIFRNNIYDRTGSAGAAAHEAAISVQFYGSGNQTLQPAGVRIAENTIHARNGRKGVFVSSTGGFANFTTGARAPEANTATSTTATTMVRTGAGWTVDQWAGWNVRIGATHGTVKTNTADTLTVTGWFTPQGDPAPTPAAAAYVITQLTGVVDILNNRIDLGNDGRGAGGYGVHVGAERTGMRVRVRGNEIRNATDYGVYVIAPTAALPIAFCEIADNIGWDDQTAATFSYLVYISTTSYINKLVIRNNCINGGSFPLAQAGPASLSTPRSWIVNDGAQQDWAGFDTPEGAVAAPVGSTYRRLNGGAATSFYVKEANTTSAGWVAK